MKRIWRIGAIGAVLVGGALAFAEVRLQGGGATFPAPLYKRLVAEYEKSHPEVKIDYQSIGSGGGIKGVTDKTFCFAGSDAPMNKKEIEKAGGADALVQVPSCAGGVVPAYNVPGVSGDIRFSGPVLADIFLGKVSKWNDAQLVELNPGVELPDLAITPAWRTDGSGTTYVWTNYLCTQSADFKGAVGSGKQVQWPIGQGGKGNEGVAAVVQQTKGAIGYIEENYADVNKIAYGAVKNRSGKFVKASAKSVSAAGAGAVDRMSGPIIAANIWDQEGEEAYPIASFTYLIVRRNLEPLTSAEDAKALQEFLWWATHEGGAAFAAEMGYAPLAPAVVKKVEEALATVKFGGEAGR